MSFDLTDALDLFAFLLLAVWCPIIIISALINFFLGRLDNFDDLP